MAKTIWKFPFETADEVVIPMPIGAEILSIQTQNRTPCLWAIIDPDGPVMPRSFRVFGTGHPLPTYGAMETVRGKYVGTYQDGALVFHLFAVGGPQ